MNESQFEDILTKYPELIEEGLSLIGRQVSIHGKYIDLLFDDRHGQKLIVELKKGAILRKHIGQLMDYEGHLLTPDDPTVRGMLIGNRVPNNLRHALNHHGFEWKELQVAALEKFVSEKNDRDLLKIFEKENVKIKLPSSVEDNNGSETFKASDKATSTELEKERALDVQFENKSRKRNMGHSTGDSLFGTKTGTMANHFCHAIIASGNIGITMAEAKKAHWNPKGYHFKETISRLIKEGLVTEQYGRYYVTEKGLKDA